MLSQAALFDVNPHLPTYVHAGGTSKLTKISKLAKLTKISNSSASTHPVPHLISCFPRCCCQDWAATMEAVGAGANVLDTVALPGPAQGDSAAGTTTSALAFRGGDGGNGGGNELMAENEFFGLISSP